MSWSLSTVLIREKTGGGIQKDLRALQSLPLENVGNQQAVDERNAQIEMAIAAAVSVLSNEPFGDAEEVSVSMSGHANPGNQKGSEFSNDYLQVSISVKKYRAL
jgi:hypothetical protein